MHDEKKSKSPSNHEISVITAVRHQGKTKTRNFSLFFFGPPSPKAMARQGQYGSTQVALEKFKNALQNEGQNPRRILPRTPD
jgi:hypothetical protein